jgi:hypothetical protein
MSSNVIISEVKIGRGDRAVEGARLEIVCTPNKGTGGSNPPLSASAEPRRLQTDKRKRLVCDELSACCGDSFGCRLLIVRSCARRNRESRQVRKEAAVTDRPLCHRVTWLSAMGIRPISLGSRVMRLAFADCRPMKTLDSRHKAREYYYVR